MTQGSTRWCMVMGKVQKYREFKHADGLRVYSAECERPLKRLFEERRLKTKGNQTI